MNFFSRVIIDPLLITSKNYLEKMPFEIISAVYK